MAKTKKGMVLNPHDDDFGKEVGDEGGDEGHHVPTRSIQTKELQETAAQASSLKAEIRDLLSDMGGLFKRFGNGGGNPKSFKAALAVGEMETEQAKDWWRSFHSYIIQLGINKKHGLDDVELFSNDQAPAPIPKGGKAPKMPSANFG